MTADTAPAAFFGKTFDEAFALLVEARNYIAYEEAIDRQLLDPLKRLMLSCEATRMTARIIHIMSWLMMRKAVFAGEIAPDEACGPEGRLDGHATCLAQGFAHGADFPPRFAELLERSRRLYVRVSRLDELLARD
jgi:regulator of CtrA degradation